MVCHLSLCLPSFVRGPTPESCRSLASSLKYLFSLYLLNVSSGWTKSLLCWKLSSKYLLTFFSSVIINVILSWILFILKIIVTKCFYLINSLPLAFLRRITSGFGALGRDLLQLPIDLSMLLSNLSACRTLPNCLLCNSFNLSSRSCNGNEIEYSLLIDINLNFLNYQNFYHEPYLIFPCKWVFRIYINYSATWRVL